MKKIFKSLICFAVIALVAPIAVLMSGCKRGDGTGGDFTVVRNAHIYTHYFGNNRKGLGWVYEAESFKLRWRLPKKPNLKEYEVDIVSIGIDGNPLMETYKTYTLESGVPVNSNMYDSFEFENLTTVKYRVSITALFNESYCVNGDCEVENCQNAAHMVSKGKSKVLYRESKGLMPVAVTNLTVANAGPGSYIMNWQLPAGALNGELRVYIPTTQFKNGVNNVSWRTVIVSNTATSYLATGVTLEGAINEFFVGTVNPQNYGVKSDRINFV